MTIWLLAFILTPFVALIYRRWWPSTHRESVRGRRLLSNDERREVRMGKHSVENSRRPIHETRKPTS
jgi:hypothetical protein